VHVGAAVTAAVVMAAANVGAAFVAAVTIEAALAGFAATAAATIAAALAGFAATSAATCAGVCAAGDCASPVPRMPATETKTRKMASRLSVMWAPTAKA